jgi:hypothetical protein
MVIAEASGTRNSFIATKEMLLLLVILGLVSVSSDYGINSCSLLVIKLARTD